VFSAGRRAAAWASLDQTPAPATWGSSGQTPDRVVELAAG